MFKKENLKDIFFKKSQVGFTLVEIVVAAVLLAIISAGILSIALSSRKIISGSHQRHTATNIAQAVLENLRVHLGADHWYNSSFPINPNFADCIPGPWCGPYDIHGGNDPLNISFIFGETEFATKYAGRWRYKFNDVAGAEYRSVTVEVQWDEPI